VNCGTFLTPEFSRVTRAVTPLFELAITKITIDQMTGADVSVRGNGQADHDFSLFVGGLA